MKEEQLQTIAEEKKEQLKKKTMLSKLNEKIEENLQEDKSTNPFGKNLRANILQTIQKTTKDLINEIKLNIVISNQISADVGISIHKNKKDPVPIIERKPVDFFMNDTFELDNS